MKDRNKYLFLFFFVFCFFLCIGNFTLASNSFPPIPDGCFDDKNYCTSNTVSGKVVQVKLFATIPTEDYESPEDLVAHYLDFNSWEDYFADNSILQILNSKKLSDLNVNGKTIWRHFSHYNSKAPWPLTRMKVREVAHYWTEEELDDVLINVRFEMAKGYTVPAEEIGENEDYVTAEGFKEKDGLIYIKLDQDEENFIVYSFTQVIPIVDLLPRLAAPYIEKNILATFKGVFDL